jgi:microsomal dipeptidase-like Zn-dependent dipeptidase
LNFVDPARPNLERLLGHVDHVAELVGPQHMGLGSDFDGFGASLEGVEDASKYPAITEGLLKSEATVTTMQHSSWEETTSGFWARYFGEAEVDRPGTPMDKTNSYRRRPRQWKSEYSPNRFWMSNVTASS